METKVCTSCNIEKELSSFYSGFDKRRNQPYSFAICRSCSTQRTKKWRSENKDKEKAIQKRNYQKNGKRYKKNFYENTIKKNWIAYSHKRKQIENRRNSAKNELASKLLEIQNNCCAICLNNFDVVGRYDIDHSHQTGMIRGLLCRKCNSGLHYFEDKEFILKAAKYIQEHPAQNFPLVKY